MSTTLFNEPLLESERSRQELVAGSTEPALLLSAVPFDLAPLIQEKARAGRRQAVSARRTSRRRVRLDWEAIAVILLILVSGAICIYRLFWSMQP